jgi:hypothetical protein
MKSRLIALLLLSLALNPLPGSAEQPATIVFPADQSTYLVADDAGLLLSLDLGLWGPGWKSSGLKGKVVDDHGAARLDLTAGVKGTKATANLKAKLTQTQPTTLTFDLALAFNQPADLTLATLGLHPASDRFNGGELQATLADGQTEQHALPLAKGGFSGPVRQLRFAAPNQGPVIQVNLTPAVRVAFDGAARLVLAEDHLSAPVALRVELTFPTAATFYPTVATVPADPSQAAWYPFNPDQAGSGPDQLSLASWLEAPAGLHGRIRADGDRLLAGNNPIKLWGLNVCYTSCAPDKALADRRADFYASHGINAVRLHKFADGAGWAGIQTPDSFVTLDAAALDRFDYFVAALKKRGIYVKFSPNFGVNPGSVEYDRIPYAAELGPRPASKKRLDTGTGATYLARELQELQFAQTTGLLKHKNPYTGLTYAEDPAVAVIELYNEDSALFFGTFTQLKKSPTLRARTAQTFTRWLKRRYGSEEKLLAAWGPTSLNAFKGEGFDGESWTDETIVPVGNPWFFDPDQLNGSLASRKQRLLDTMAFLHDLQSDYYARYTAVIRAAGYTGELLASNWQAGRDFSHYYNLHSDAQVGLIDRHNYFSGMARSMVAIPGSGSLSSGMMQVAGRPFMLSEWIHVSPNEFGVEGPAIIAAYGLGLQGWDVSFLFQNKDDGGYADTVGKDKWEATAPQIAALFPAVARQVHRGDVREADLVAPRRVNVAALNRGQLDFSDTVSQKGDVKTFNSDKVPAATLAVAKTLVEFTDADPALTPVFDLVPFRQPDGSLRSSTGQLDWHAGKSILDGWFTINTPGTQAVVGFSAGQTFDLADVRLAPTSHYGAIYITARARDATLATGQALLVTALARARNTGQKVAFDRFILEKGSAPVVLEPVKFTLTLKRGGSPRVELLDHAGRATGKTLPVKDGSVEIDTARDRTPFYLITY